MRKRIIGVIGAGVAGEDACRLAEETGKLIAENDAILITGGMGGIMEAASKGAKAAGGLVIGILPGGSAADANPWVDIPILTGIAEARNAIIARTAEALIAITGEYGTLSEIAFGLKFGKPVISLQSWAVDARIVQVEKPKEAVETALRMLP